MAKRGGSALAALLLAAPLLLAGCSAPPPLLAELVARWDAADGPNEARTLDDVVPQIRDAVQRECVGSLPEADAERLGAVLDDAQSAQVGASAGGLTAFELHHAWDTWIETVTLLCL